ncbi:hypothetical protein ACF0H5_010472 [Mactra antiquata]
MTFVATGLTFVTTGMTFVTTDLIFVTTGMTFVATGLTFVTTGMTCIATAMTFVTTGMTFVATAVTFVTTGMTCIATAMTFVTTGMTFVATAMTFVTTGMTFVATAMTFVTTGMTFVATAMTFVTTGMTFVATAMTFVTTGMTFVATAMTFVTTDDKEVDFLDIPQVVESCITDFCGCCPCYPRDTENPDNVVLSKMGLPYMLMKEIYIDAFILHEDSELSKIMETSDDDIKELDADNQLPLIEDPRKKLDETWTKFYKFQPIWKIRNYFGEKIALYFAWAGLLISSLWIPTIFGLCCFFYGLSVSAQRSDDEAEMPANLTAQGELKWRMGQLYNTISGSFDNDVTPYFALVICLWGTIFLEFWKRYNARLAYEWDVDQFEQNEPDRPEFFGTKVKKDPVTQKHEWFYSGRRQFLKFCISASSLIFMICLVFVSLAAVVVYRVIISVDFCGGMSAVSCLITSSVVSALLNATSILILGRIYDVVALKLTEWENHRTQTQFNDALIIKLFAFSFANSYASCFYIAFFRGRFGGIFGLPSEYNDECEGDSCMSQLSFQVFILMLAKPFPKFIKDIILPYIKKLWRTRCCCKDGCSCCCGNNKVSDDDKSKLNDDSGASIMNRSKAFIRKERYKPELGDFTLGEYTEKVIVYGFLMLFAASFPLAPFIALVILFVDKHIDAKRLLWLNRRPIAFIAQDLGMWYGILNFVNLIGVVSNGFLIAFTSSWGLRYSIQTRLWICLGFEHIVFALKFLLAYLIPDVPKDVRLAIRREKYQVAKKFEDKGNRTDYYSDLVPAATYDDTVKPNSPNYDNFPILNIDDDDDDDDTYPGGSKPLPTLTEVQEDKVRSPKGSEYGIRSISGVDPEGSQLIEPVVVNSNNEVVKMSASKQPASDNILESEDSDSMYHFSCKYS